MPEPFVGEIRMFGGSFAPAGWAFCDGQLIPISENDTLFTLIGTTYGGDGQETFALPNLQSRIPIHAGTGSDGINYTLGEQGGVETVTLTTNQIPIHTHALVVNADIGTQNIPTGNVLAQCAGVKVYTGAAPGASLNTQSIGPAGGSQPHENSQPFLCVNFIISLFGVFPTQ
ncbi:MAG: tail fiber protein [Acidobacteria bacterium]|nr:tail fiber protein [Acidobacteriota bacterium]